VNTPAPGLRESATFDRNVIHEIQRAAETGIYDIRGWALTQMYLYEEISIRVIVRIDFPIPDSGKMV
jgi:hypothetical protein